VAGGLCRLLELLVLAVGLVVVVVVVVVVAVVEGFAGTLATQTAAVAIGAGGRLAGGVDARLLQFLADGASLAVTALVAAGG
jgi:hypothetical protein